MGEDADPFEIAQTGRDCSPADRKEGREGSAAAATVTGI